MEHNRTRNSVYNALSGMGNRAVSLLIPFVLRTALIYTLGEQYVGLSSLFASILQVLNLAELGFASAVTYNMYRPIVEKDDAQICALLNLYRKIFLSIAAFILVAGLCVMPFLECLISGEYPTDINLQLLYLIYLSNTVLSYAIFAHKRALLNAHQKSYIERNINSILYLVFDIARIVLLFTVQNYYFYVIFYPIATIVENCFIAYMAKKLYPQYVCKGKIDKETVAAIKKRVAAICIQKFGDTISTSLDSIVISSFLGLTALAIYSNYYYIVASLMSFIGIIVGGASASIGQSMVNDSRETNYLHFKRLSLLNSWGIAFCLPCMLCLYQHFMYIWVGASLMADNSLVICLLVYFFVAQSRQMVTIFKISNGMWWEDRWKPLVGAGVNLCLNVTLVRFVGVEGVIVSTIVSYLFVELPWESQVLFKLYFKKSVKYHYAEVLKCLAVTAVASALCWVACSPLPSDTILMFFVKAAICFCVVNAVFLLVYYKTDEFQYLKNKALKR